jgi:hypothetical protein
MVLVRVLNLENEHLTKTTNRGVSQGGHVQSDLPTSLSYLATSIGTNALLVQRFNQP